MGIFDNCLLVSDIDDTLVSSNTINPINIEKIEYFMREGGFFSLATGRTVKAISVVLEQLKKLSPCVVANGCMIYDYNNGVFLHKEYISKSDYKIIEDVMKQFSEIGVEIYVGDRVYNVKNTKEVEAHLLYEKLENTHLSFEEAKKLEWSKGFFTLTTAEMRDELNAFLSRYDSNCDFVNTMALVDGNVRYYVEQVPKGVSKASTLSKLVQILNVEKGNIFAIGDYYNDVAMLEMADISAVVADSPADVKTYADYITCSCKDGAVADFIDYLTKIKSHQV